jgi:hypothetical protein
MKTLRTYGNLAEAGFAKSLLEAAGISAELADEHTYALGYGRAVGELRLQVEEQDIEKAAHVLEEGPDTPTFQAGHAAPPDSSALTEENKPLPHFPSALFLAAAVTLAALFFAVAHWRRGGLPASAGEETLDADGDGRVDTIYTYLDDYPIGARIDRNRDGNPDFWEQYTTNGILLTVRLDENFDGKPDLWLYYSAGNIELSETDTDFNGIPDLFASYKDGVQQSTEVRPNGASIPTRRQRFKNGRLIEEIVDSNHDGQPDYRIEFDPFGNPSEHLPIEPTN